MVNISLKVRAGADTTVVELAGVIDAARVALLQEALVDAIMRRRPQYLVVDLLRVTDIDSTGIGALVAASGAAEDMGVAFDLCCPSPAIAAELAARGVQSTVTACL